MRRGVAQFGSALGSGPRGRGFKSRLLDHEKPPNVFGGFYLPRSWFCRLLDHAVLSDLGRTVFICRGRGSAVSPTMKRPPVMSGGFYLPRSWFCRLPDHAVLSDLGRTVFICRGRGSAVSPTMPHGFLNGRLFYVPHLLMSRDRRSRFPAMGMRGAIGRAKNPYKKNLRKQTKLLDTSRFFYIIRYAFNEV